MNKAKTKTTKDQSIVSLPLVNAHAAGIDIGDTIHAVAVPEDRDEKRVRTFGTMTCDLQLIVEWLQKCKIETVAMESTGVYWKPLFSMLSRAGFEVLLVNARQVRNVTGRKNDEDDAMWIQKLHSCGLLKSCYLPEDEQEALRTLVRFRRALIQDCSRFVLRMQKSLELMNIKIHTIISDITGQTGTAIIEAIISGERKAESFLPFVGKGIKADQDTIVKSLQGNWRDEHLYTLEEAYNFYKYYKQRITANDRQIELTLQQYEAYKNGGEIKTDTAASKRQNKKRKDKNHPRFDVRGYLERIHGVDVLAIYGLSETGGLEVLAETGTNMSKWENDKHFISWLNLCSNNKISGGKVISTARLKKKPNPAAQAFKSAANAVQKSDHWLGDYFRRMKAKGGNKYAVIATAHKLAGIYYKMVRYKQEFKPVDLTEYHQKYKQAKIAYLQRKLNDLKQQVE